MKPLIPVTTQSSDGAFYDENKVTGEEGTIVDAAYMNNMQSALRSVQSEIISILATAGMQPDQASVNQLLTALDGRFAKVSSPAFTGVPTAPTAALGTNTQQLATTAFVRAITDELAPLASPALTGVPTGPTATVGTNTQQLATTAFVTAALTKLLPMRSPFTDIGSIRIPDVDGGLIIQWGSKLLAAQAGTSVLFHRAFPATCLGIIMSPNDSDTTASYRVSATSAAVNGFTGVSTKPQNTAISYLAVGY